MSYQYDALPMVATTSQVAAFVFGILAAFFWWRSTVIGISKSKDMPSAKTGGDGDLLFQHDDGFLEIRFSDQARANAIAALFSGLAVIAPAIPTALNCFGLH